MPALAVAADAPLAGPLDVAAVYRAHAAFIARVIARLLGDGTHVDDVLQETFAIAFRKRYAFDPTRASVETWLYGIAAHLCMRQRRTVLRFAALRTKLSAAEPASRSPAPDRELARRQTLEVAEAVITELPFKLREVFVLYELEERSGQQIATMLDIPLGTVWTRLAAARRRFTEAARARLATEVTR